MGNAFFEVTRDSLDSVTDLCNLIHPITVSMWNMRSEIAQIQSWLPEVTNQQLGHKFTQGSNISPADCISAFTKTTWEEHQESIAWIFLNNLFAVYEGWLRRLGNEVFDEAHGALSLQAMQFPLQKKAKIKDKDGNEIEVIQRNGILEELDRLTSCSSELLYNAFFERYAEKKHRCFIRDSNSKKLILDKKLLKNLLFCYRYFKELRNCYFHNAMLASDQLLNAYSAFSANVSTADDLGLDRIPEHCIPEKGKKVSVSLYGVTGFSRIILMIMLTIDAQLLCSKYSERELVRRLQTSRLGMKAISLNRRKMVAIQEIVTLANMAKFSNPKFPTTGTLRLFVDMLVDNSIVKQMDYYKDYNK